MHFIQFIVNMNNYTKYISILCAFLTIDFISFNKYTDIKVSIGYTINLF